MADQPAAPTGPDFAQGIAIGNLADGAMLVGHVGEEVVVLVRRGETFFAIGAKCSHYGGPLGEGVLDGETVRCPWHHACFSLRTGEALRAPGIDPVPRFQTERAGDRVYVRGKLPAPAARKPPAAALPIARIVIIGGGVAGFAAAERLRREGFTGSLTMLSADRHPPADRPNLSKDYLAGKAPEEWVFLKPARFYAEHRIDLQLAADVTSIDPATRTVTVGDGHVFVFDRLLLAIGAEPVRLPLPGADLPHVFTLRSFADSRAISAKAAESARAVVIGASFIGLEVAASLVTRGLEVHVVAPEPRPLEHVLGPAFGDAIRAEHDAHGVVFHLGRKPAAIAADSVTLDNGARLPADLVVMGTGVKPRLELAHAAGLRCEHGVLVNDRLETSIPGIFAAGDIARFPYPLAGGGAIRVEHFVVAERQGQVAAANILGLDLPYRDAPFFWSQHYDLPINVVGHAGRWDALEVVGDLRARDGLVRYRHRGEVVAVASIYRDRDSLLAELALEASEPVRV
jgi:NADPH-dependent 2,4-dienoyl-CoA reductase/sulfur reductase-like enzyme/nitrite reductase/ring-hydroxylating ferredoxin subunit